VSRITILLIPVVKEAAMSYRLNPELAPRVAMLPSADYTDVDVARHANACFTHTPAPRHRD
jgi:hypothetical protein